MGQIEHFVPGKRIEPWGPLARYIEPMPAGVATAYIEAYSEPGEIVLTPFCQSETVVQEAVKAGRKVIAANFNPAAVLSLRCRLNWPERSQLDAAVTKLGDTPKHNAPLRWHLNGLYATTCPQCLRPIVADYFIWEQNELVEKGYRCPSCGSEGVAPVQGADIELLEDIEKRGFHYWYILDRLAPLGDGSRERAKKLLDLYTPRNLYALATLLIEIENQFADPPLQEALKSILLHCLDSCNILNPFPPEASRPRSLRRPRRFLERNVWQAFEETYMEMREQSPLPPVRLAEHLEEIIALAPVGGEIPNTFIKVWSVRHLVRRMPEESIPLIFAAPPRLDPSFWALSYLWSGWLLGREAATALKPLLERRRPDWPWYRRTMEAAFGALGRLLGEGGRLVLAFSTDEPTMMEALLLAAEGAGLPAENVLYRKDGQYQLSFTADIRGFRGFIEAGRRVLTPPDKEAVGRKIQAQAQAAAEEALRERGEPLTFPRLHNAICRRLSRDGLLRRTMEVREEGFSPLDFTAQRIETALEGESLVRLAEFWWLKRPDETRPSLADRVEKAVYEALSRRPTISRGDLLKEIYVLFPGSLTPEVELIDACLSSYGLEITPGLWQLRAEDRRENREGQRSEIITQLMEFGRRLGYKAEPYGDAFDVLWCEKGEAMHAFTVSWMATLGRGAGELNRYLVIPGERAPLMSFKLERNPSLQRAVNRSDWQLIKWRHIAELLRMEEMDRHDLKRIVGLEPIIEKPEAQIPLFR